MTDHIRAIAEQSISEGKTGEVKKLVTEIIKRVEANEPNMLSYEFFLSDDESKLYALETYKDSEAVMAHLGNVGDLLGPLFEIAPLTELRVYGNPSDEVRQATESFGPKIFEHWNGFIR